MRIGVFGGTFDPVHQGHLILAEQCREQGRLDEVLFVPAARPPHKVDRSLTPFSQRVEMLALALAGQPAFRIGELERDRPGPSFTADTLDELHEHHPTADFWLIVGSDTLQDLPFWHDPLRIIRRAGLLVVARPDWPIWSPEQLQTVLCPAEPIALRQEVVHMPLIDISSTDLRRRTAERSSIRYMVPRAVECYIATHRLYQA